MRELASHSERSIAELMARHVVWDNHACMPLRPHDLSFMPQLERLRAAGVDVVSLNIGFDHTSIEDHFRVVAAMRDWIGQRPDEYLLLRTADDVHTAKAAGKLAVLFDIEGMKAVDDQPSLVGLYYDLGVRWMSVAYNMNNKAGGGCQDADEGLTDLGRKILDRMAEVGMVACCSHTGYRTARDVIDYSPNPVIFSHSNPLGLHQHPRNIPDDLMIACAEKGGLVCLNGIGLYLGGASTEIFVRAVDYTAKVIGSDHVALGLDYVFDFSELDELIAMNPEMFPPSLGYGSGMTQSTVEPERIPEVGQSLLDIGYSEIEVANILGGNLVRLSEQVWK